MEGDRLPPRPGERTVKRWEVERGLPVHRVPGSGRATVYAYTQELDEWLLSNAAQSQESQNEPVVAAGDRPLDHGVDAIHESRTGLPETQYDPQPSPRSIVTQAKFAVGAVLVVLAAAGAAAFAVHRKGLDFTKGHSLVRAEASGVSDGDRRQAHDLYLQGRYEWNRRTPESLNRALDDFTRSAVLNPYAAESYVGLADTYNLMQIYATMPLTDSIPRALAAAKRAVQLDDSMAEAHRALAFTEFYGTGAYAESEKEFRRAIELNPNDPVTRRWYGNAFAMPGRYPEMLAQLNRARELDPSSNSTLSEMGIILYNMGRQDEGVALLKQVEKSDPKFYSPHLYLSLVAFEKRDYRNYLDEAQKAADIRNNAVEDDILAHVRRDYQTHGTAGFLKSLYAQQKEYASKGLIPPGDLAFTCIAMNRRQEAMRLFEAAYSVHRGDSLWVLSDPYVRQLRSEPGYKELVEKINFPGFSIDQPMKGHGVYPGVSR